MPETADPLIILTSQIVAAYVAANAVDARAVAGLIRDIHQSLVALEPGRLEPGDATSGATRTRPEPPTTQRSAVEIRKSVFADHLICLEDGQKLTTLKRHLRAAHGLTPDQYRAKWGLPASYPMVAPAYGKTRSAMAKASGLGRKAG